MYIYVLQVYYIVVAYPLLPKKNSIISLFLPSLYFIPYFMPFCCLFYLPKITHNTHPKHTNTHTNIIA